mmetsp:Transcript_1258/g.4103  ORF Transcript_1258/g.4103 Transcript_1258/m.4103 type:complete len:269 (+) Transcript_1258:221-1027(+)
MRVAARVPPCCPGTGAFARMVRRVRSLPSSGTRARPRLRCSRSSGFSWRCWPKISPCVINPTVCNPNREGAPVLLPCPFCLFPLVVLIRLLDGCTRGFGRGRLWRLFVRVEWMAEDAGVKRRVRRVRWLCWLAGFVRLFPYAARPLFSLLLHVFPLLEQFGHEDASLQVAVAQPDEFRIELLHSGFDGRQRLFHQTQSGLEGIQVLEKILDVVVRKTDPRGFRVCVRVSGICKTARTLTLWQRPDGEGPGVWIGKGLEMSKRYSMAHG